MKFTVNRTELLAAAQNAERIAPRVSTIEILQCAYLQAEQDTLTVASGNLEIALEQRLPAQIESEGSVVVKAPLLSGMLRLLDGERVTFQMKSGKLVVSSGNAEYAIPVMDAEQYPRMEIPCPAATVPVSGIPSLTKRTAFAVSEDTTRPMLKCVNLIFGADGLQAVSTAGKAGRSGKRPREAAGRYDRESHCLSEGEFPVRRANYGRAVPCRVAGVVQSETAVYGPDRRHPAP